MVGIPNQLVKVHVYIEDRTLLPYALTVLVLGLKEGKKKALVSHYSLACLVIRQCLGFQKVSADFTTLPAAASILWRTDHVVRIFLAFPLSRPLLAMLVDIFASVWIHLHQRRLEFC